ncbi:MAG: DUF58 domain-containing protein [Chloroflexi bacterium]|nr:DUF58 domain-containing protein [Chloroflexota bacterium]
MSRLLNLAIALVLVGLVLRSELISFVGLALGAVSLLSRFWLRQVERGLRVSRQAPDVLAAGEEATITVQVSNPTLLRIPWIEVRESLPFALRTRQPQHQVISLGAGQSYQLMYQIRGARRGWYPLGPTQLILGDALGLSRLALQVPPRHITIYPRVLPLSALGLPATLSVGPLTGRRGEDPARPAGVRQYVPGDDVRRLDWKSSARQSTLLVRRADPTIAPETTIGLAFARDDYEARTLQDSLERAVVAAASLSMALLQRKLPVSLIANGYEPEAKQSGVILPFGKGDGQRRLLLGVLGRLELGQNLGLFDLLHSQPLPWGGTLVLVLADLTLDVLPNVVALRRRGQQITLLLVEGSASGQALAAQQHLSAYVVDRQGQPVGVAYAQRAF